MDMHKEDIMDSTKANNELEYYGNLFDSIGPVQIVHVQVDCPEIVDCILNIPLDGIEQQELPY